jgi:hypothetical protein
VALEHRLLAHSQATRLDLARLRKRVTFERLLARLLVAAPDRWMLKGGLALDFRLGSRARSTVDMDLGRHDDETATRADFDAAQETDLGDYFEFDIVRTALLDEADVAGAIRYRVRASLAGRRFEDFVVDVGFSETIEERDEIDGPDLLTFADLPQIRVPTLPLSLHIAEKVHAYTRRYGEERRPSTRVKDLVDLVLISTISELSAREIRAALDRTFSSRATHPLPPALPEPPPEWITPYRRMAQSLAVPSDTQEGHRIAAALLDPILAGQIDDDASWDVSAAMWIPTGAWAGFGGRKSHPPKPET